ncbi:FHA domain protein [Planctomycetes bacterium CA13]|uniref:FHA domain protein n=1 Tax=Novipirellula herctigrandis TaxID=2527986 RepID=A0A5C5Z9R0_9BACT|nr:FHA domain protein [Planctomycetes bacterium CA13]
MQVKLKVLTGSHTGKEIAVASEKFLIGRSDSCQLRPKSESVSRKHCILVLKEGRVLIQDLKSRNGTFVNEKRLPIGMAKVLKPGDLLKIGKLEFEIVIEHGLQAAKKPEVTGVGDAAARTVEAGSHDSRFEEVDVSSWLDEADQIDRVRKVSDPETRQLKLDATENEKSSGDSTELSVDDSEMDDKKRKIPEKMKPGKLPEGLRKQMKENSRDAADDALKRFFSGR